MSGTFVDKTSRWASLPATVAIIATLALMSWAISTDNLWAAMLAGSLLAAVIVFGGTVVFVPDNIGPQMMDRTLHLALTTLDKLSDGLTPEGCEAVCQMILNETNAHGVSLTDTHRVLAYVGEQDAIYPPGSPNTDPTKQVLRDHHAQTFSTKEPWHVYGEGLPASEDSTRLEQEGYPVTIIAPLMAADKSVGTLKLYYRSAKHYDGNQYKIACDLAKFISVLLSTYELNRQAGLTAQAELKALQAQINPHFLFNTLNTIASLTRTDPEKARVLLRDFSGFYRRTLEGSESRITLAQELEQTRRYLTIERARFGEDRIVETEYIEEGLENVMVPSFLIQPIVENAVRHAMRDEGPLHIDVHATTENQDILIAVADDGLGMDEDAKRRLETQAKTPKDASSGTGIALHNVAERVERFYGVGSDVGIVSRLGEGTVITLRLADAVPADFELGASNEDVT